MERPSLLSMRMEAVAEKARAMFLSDQDLRPLWLRFGNAVLSCWTVFIFCFVLILIVAAALFGEPSGVSIPWIAISLGATLGGGLGLAFAGVQDLLLRSRSVRVNVLVFAGWTVLALCTLPGPIVMIDAP